jgi:hypothetical protein
MKDEQASRCATLLRELSAVEPSPEIVERAIARTRAVIEGTEKWTADGPEVEARSARRPIPPALLGIAAVVAVAATAYLLMAITSPNTFADVQSALTEVSTVSFTVEVLAAPADARVAPGVATIDLDGDRYRFESADKSLITIDDRQRGIFLYLDLMDKRAVVMRDRARARNPSFAEFLEAVRKCDLKWVEHLPNGEIDGRHVERFRLRPDSHVSFAGQEIVVSVDPTTHLPLQFDIKSDALGAPLHLVYRDFSFAPAEPELFSTQVPEGFELDDDGRPAKPELAE